MKDGRPVVVGLFDDLAKAARAAEALRALPVPEEDLETISPVPLPDGSVLRDPRGVDFPRFSIAGWFLGALAGLSLALATYLLYPMITGGKALISVPPTLIVTYEVAMLGALLGTIVTGAREMGLWRLRGKVHDPAIHDGAILLCARVAAGEAAERAAEAMRAAGGTRVRAEEGAL